MGQQIGLSVAAIQRYKAGHIPPESRTVQILAEAAVARGRLDRRWLEEFLVAAQHPAPTALVQQLFPPQALEVVPPPPAVPIDPNRSRMLEKVYAFWVEGVLNQSLHGAVLLELGLQERPEAVARPWDAVVQQPERPARPLLPGTPLISIYDELDQALLLLGAPGAGKTTMLLELARDLIARAQESPQHPIPVVFNLSTWSGQHQRLDDWLVDELHLRYQVPRRISQGWVNQAQVLPLLDGLDEVSLERRPQCVEAINRFRQHHGLLGIAVASRIADYELLANKLQLHGAVLIQPLSERQIERYTAETGPALAGMRQALRDDAALRELAETPLMLSIMSLAYRGETAPNLGQPAALDERRAQLFETYIGRMFERRTATAPTSPQQVRRWLGWLAHQMTSRAQTIFFLEGLQPGWLASPRQRLLFSAATGAVMGLVAWVLGILGVTALMGLNFASSSILGNTTPVSLPGLLPALFGLLLLIAGIVLGIRARTWRLTQWALGLGLSGVGLTLATFGYWGMSTNYVPSMLDLLPSLGLSLLIGGGISMLGGLLRMARGDDGETTVKVVETLHWSRQRALPGFVGGVLLGQILGFWIGWNTSGPFIISWLQWLTAMSLALAIGLGLGLLSGLLTGLVGNQVDLRTRPNQGIHESARYMLRGMLTGPLVGLILGPILAGGVMLATYFNSPQMFFWWISLFATGAAMESLLAIAFLPLLFVVGMIAFAPVLGALVALPTGGMACLQHSVLRLLLGRQGALPLNYTGFLDYAAERLFLRKVGGGYIFVHRLLLEHFAATDGHEWARLIQRRTAHATASWGELTIRLTNGGTEEVRKRHREPVESRWDVLWRRWPGLGRLAGSLAAFTSVVMLAAIISLNMWLYTPSANMVRTMQAQMPLAGLALAANEREAVAVGVDGSIERWMTSSGAAVSLIGATGPQVYVSSGPTGSVTTPDRQTFATIQNASAIAPDGTTYVTTSYRDEPLVEVRRSSDGALLQRFPGNQVAFSPDSQFLAVAESIDGGVQIWRIRDGTLVSRTSRQSGLPPVLTFSPDGSLLAIGDWLTLEVVRVSDGVRLHRFDQGDFKHAIAIAPDNQTLALSTNNEVRLLRMSDGTVVQTLQGHENSVLGLAFSPDGRTLASGGYDRTVRLWRSSDGALLQVLRGHQAAITGLVFSADGRSLFSASYDRTVRLWQVAP